MIEKKQIYKCSKCGNVIESLWNGKPYLGCCGEVMQKMIPNTVDVAREKHVPVIVRDGNKVTVKVGSVAHPMASDHYILFVELLQGQKVYRHDFKEGDTKAEADFYVEDNGQELIARAFCNLHDLWEGK